MGGLAKGLLEMAMVDLPEDVAVVYRVDDAPAVAFEESAEAAVGLDGGVAEGDAGFGAVVVAFYVDGGAGDGGCG